MKNIELLKTMCAIEAPAGNEINMTNFVLEYIQKNSASWKVKPEVLYGPDFQDCIVLVFGTPRTAIFAHMDSIGYTVRYKNEVVKIGGPKSIDGITLIGEDSKGKIECTFRLHDEKMSVEYPCEIDRGTMLTFKPEFRETEDYVQCCYMDNRLGVWNALQVAETLENGIICFSCWEETGGGSVEYLIKFINEQYGIRQAIISDITWVTDGVPHGEGVVISLRDSGVPRRSYVNRIIDIAKKNKINYQLEVESSGGSDGNILHRSPYPIDWCFVGAPEDFVHTPDEKVHKKDIAEMVKLYEVLMKEL